MLSLIPFATSVLSRVALAAGLFLTDPSAATPNTATPKAATPKAATPKAAAPTSKAGPTSKGTAASAKPETPPGAVPSQANLDPQIAAVVDKVQAKYDGARDFTAAFDQTITNAVTKRASVSAGKVSFKKGGKMRWDYTSPEPRMIVADGTRLWLWEPEDQQAFRQELASSQLPSALAFLTGTGKLTDEFTIAIAKPGTYGKTDDQVLELSPKKPSAQVQRIFFVVDPATSFVRETAVLDGQGNSNHLAFRDIRTNTNIPDSAFTWSPPAGTRIIDPSGQTAPKKP